MEKSSYSKNNHTLRYGYLFVFVIGVFFANIVTAQIPTSGLVGYWPFNGNANDMSGNGNHGILECESNNPQLTTDRFGNANSAYEFGGYYNKNWIRVPNNSTMLLTNQMTISLWFQQCEFAGMNGWGSYSTTDAGFSVFTKAGDGIAAYPGIFIGSGINSQTGKLTISSSNCNGAASNPSYANYGVGTEYNCFDTCEWVHFVSIINDTIAKIYLNGVLYIDTIINHADYTQANLHDLYIGRMGCNGFIWYPFNGKIDDVAFYNRALSDDEVAQLFGHFYDEHAFDNIITIDSIIVINACNGDDGMVQIFPDTSNAPYQYSLDYANNFQSSNIIQNISSGVHRIYIKSACGLKDTLIDFTCCQNPPVILHSPDTTIQFGDSATLWASGADVLYWTDANGNILISGPTLTVSPTSTTLYYVTGQNMSANINENLVVNGDFEQGNVYFTSEYSYVSSSSVLGEGYYTIGPNAHNYHPDFYNGPDHTTGAGNFMILNGTGTPNTNVWTQTVPVTPHTNYAFSTWVSSLVSSSPAMLQFSVNGSQLGDIFMAPNTWGIWSRYYEVWNSGNNTSAVLTILNQNTTLMGNDFGLDDIVFAPLTTCSATESILVHLPEFPDNVDSADCTFLPTATEWSIAQPIISDVGNAIIVSTPMIGDIDDDGQQEIVIPSSTTSIASQLNIYHSDGTLKSQFNIAGTWIWNSIGMAKVKWNNSLYKTIIVVFGTNNYLYAYDANGTQLWQSDQPFSSHNGENCKMPAISFADFNHDGWTEVFIGSEIFDAATGVLLCKANGNKGCADRTWDWSNTPYQTVAADLCGDTRLELAIGNAIYSVDIQSRTNFSANTISVAHQVPTSAMKMEDGSQIPFTDGNTFLADINLNGSLDVIVMNVDGNNRIVYIYVWDVATNTIICSKKITNARKFGTPQIGDLDNDGYPEICFITGTYSGHGGDNDNIHALKYNPSNSNGAMDEFWSIPHGDNSGSTGLTMFDFNQDGYVELVYRDCDNLRIINGSLYNHQTGQPVAQPYDLAFIPCHSATGIEYPIIADVDLDGEVEIIVGGETFSTDFGHVYIFKSGGIPWAPARPVWNQFMYNVTNVNKDLTIPQNLFNNATPFTNPQGVVRRPFNNFLQQATTIDQYGRPFYAVPDVAMDTSASSQMVGDSLVLTFSYCNLGDNMLNAPYPVTVFANAYGGDSIGTFIMSHNLPVDSCTQSEIHLSVHDLCAIQNLNTLVVAVNCAGNGIAQNGNLQPECDTTNNTTSVTVDFLSVSVVLTEQACDSYIWNGTTYNTSGTYTVSFTNDYGCDSTVTLQLTINHSVETEDYLTLCENQLPYTYGDTVFAPGTPPSETFILHRFTFAGCDSVVTLHLTVNPTGLTEFYDSVCQNMAYSGYGFSILEEETAESGSHIFDRTLSNQFGCDSVIRLHLYVKPVITPDFYADPDKAMLSDPPLITFVNNTNTVEIAQSDFHWVWDFGDGATETTTEPETSHLYTNWGDYTVTLTLWADGCMDSTSVIVFIEADLEFPNVITPNGDGINDVFIIKNLNPDRPNRLYISDRWGKVVWSKDNYQTYMKDGQVYNAASGFGMGDLSAGVYYYAFYYEGAVRTIKFNGSITVVK